MAANLEACPELTAGNLRYAVWLIEVTVKWSGEAVKRSQRLTLTPGESDGNMNTLRSFLFYRGQTVAWSTASHDHMWNGALEN